MTVYKLLVAQYINKNLGDHDMTYKKLAEISHVPASTIHAYAQGKTNSPSEENLVRIAAAFGHGPEVIHDMHRASLDSTVRENLLIASSDDKDAVEQYAALIRTNVAQILEEYRAQSAAQQTEIIQHADRRVLTAREEAAKQCQLVAEQCRQHEHEYKQQCDALVDAERRVAAAEHAADVDRVARLERTLLRYRIVSAILLIVALLIAFAHSACAEEFDWYSTKHFVYAVPSGWQKYESDAALTFISDPSDPFAGYLHIQETDEAFLESRDDLTSSVITTVAQTLYGEAASNLLFKSIDNDYFGFVLVGAGAALGVPTNLAAATIVKDKCTLTMMLACSQLSRDELSGLIDRLVNSLIHLPSPEQPATAPSSPSDPLAFVYDIGNDVYAKRFRGAMFVDSSGYMFVDSDAGYADHQRVDMALINAKDYLEQLRPYLDSGEFAFKEINFRTYLKCVDNYGNVEDVKVLSFWLKMEDVLKMKFETMPLSGLRALSYDWYQHSVFK